MAVVLVLHYIGNNGQVRQVASIYSLAKRGLSSRVWSWIQRSGSGEEKMIHGTFVPNLPSTKAMQATERPEDK